jgi:cytidylate kinase
MSFIVAIDGPAGTGKGTVTKIIAKDLNLISIDTGAMYRCVALYSLRNNIDLENNSEIHKIFENIIIELKPDKTVYLNNEDVSTIIRTPEIDLQVKKVATIQPIRLKMVELMRNIAKNKNIIMEGRDIGTAVFPNANVKIYLDAEPEERARRRYKENCEKNIECSYDKILEDMIARDKSDLTKGGLKKAEDAIIVDTTNLSIEEVVNKIEKIIEENKNGKDF